MKSRGAPGEPMSLFMAKVDACQKPPVIRTNLDETISVVGPIGWDRKSALRCVIPCPLSS